MKPGYHRAACVENLTLRKEIGGDGGQRMKEELEGTLIKSAGRRSYSELHSLAHFTSDSLELDAI